MPKFPLTIQFIYFFYFILYVLSISVSSFPMLSMIAREKFLPFVSFSERKKLFMKNKED